MMKIDNSTLPVRAMEASLPVSDIRLVVARENLETGITEDVIVEKVVVWSKSTVKLKQTSELWEGMVVDNQTLIDEMERDGGRTRWIPSLNLHIPWPEKSPEEHKDYDADSLRINVDAKTWVPLLLSAPLPRGVIDELRNKYSKFRTRHDEDYLEKKRAQDAQEEWLKRVHAAMMVTPRKPNLPKPAVPHRQRSPPVLTDEVAVAIGKAMEASGAAAHDIEQTKDATV
jgi:large subunit ribosomal protein L24